MAEIFKTGVLIKKSRNRGALALLDNWQERKICLTRDQVTYGPVDGPTKDGIPIGMTSRVEACDASVGAGKSLRISTGDNELILCAPDEFIRDEWIKAIITIAHDPTPDDHSDDAGRLNKEMDSLHIEQEKQKKIDLAAAAAKALAMESDTAKKVREAAEAAAFLLNKKSAEEAESKKKLRASMQQPCECQKKLSTESSYHTRWIWVDPIGKTFHWAKSAEDVSKSKSISIMTHIKSVKANALPDVLEPNFTIELADAAELPDSVFASKMFSSALPSSIDVTMANATMNLGFVNYMNEIKNPPPPPPALTMPNISMPSIGMPSIGMPSLSVPSASSMLGVPSTGSMMRSAGVPSSVVSAGNDIARATK